MSETYSKAEVANMAADWWTELLVVNMWQLKWERKHADYIVIVPEPLSNWHILTFNKVLESQIMEYLNSEKSWMWHEAGGAWRYARSIYTNVRAGTCNNIKYSCDCIGIDTKYFPMADMSLSRSGVIGFVRTATLNLTTGVYPTTA